MDGSVTGAAPGHDEKSGRFVAGHSEYKARQVRIELRTDQLSREYDAQRQLLRIVATHLDQAERTRSSLLRTRATNCAARLLRGLPKKSESKLVPTIASHEKRQRRRDRAGAS